VEGVRGSSRDAFIEKHLREEGCCKVSLNNAQDWHGSSPSLSQTLKDKGVVLGLQYTSTRERWRCCRGQWGSLVELLWILR
jgi:hypothetical protein